MRAKKKTSEEAIIADTEERIVTCSYCYCGHGVNLLEIVDRIISCNSCILDIENKGKWSGFAMEALHRSFIADSNNPRWPFICKILGLTMEEIEKRRV